MNLAMRSTLFSRTIRSTNLQPISIDIFRNYSSLNDGDCPPVNSWNTAGDLGGASCQGAINEGSGLILGAYQEENSGNTNTICLTKATALLNHNLHNRIIDTLRASGPLPKLAQIRVLPKLDPSFELITVVGVGNNNAGYSKKELIDESKENIRKAVGAAVRYLQALKVEKIYVEGFEDPESAAEGACLGLWENQHLKVPEERKVSMPELVLYGDCDWKKWRIGLEKAEAQNFARKLMETPANLMTPRAFAYTVIQALCKSSVNVTLRGENWIKENNMNAFVSNTKGSPQQPLLLEMNYNGCDPAIPPVVLIGKGLTFNSGGLCLKTCKQMKHMRGDMAGAAVVVAVFRALANLGLPINVRGLIPLGENMPGGTAARSRDIVKSTSGKSILISNRDFDGNLMLADTLCYAQSFKPKYIVSVANLTKEMEIAFELTASGCFTNNERLWQLLKTSAVHTGDRLWKCPLWTVYEREVKDFTCADLSNLKKFVNRGFSCTNAAFLNQFVCKPNWAHLDTFGTMYENGRTTYLKKGMSGRPTRTIIEFLGQMAYPPLELLDNVGTSSSSTSSTSSTSSEETE